MGFSLRKTSSVSLFFLPSGPGEGAASARRELVETGRQQLSSTQSQIENIEGTIQLKTGELKSTDSRVIQLGNMITENLGKQEEANRIIQNQSTVWTKADNAIKGLSSEISSIGRSVEAYRGEVRRLRAQTSLLDWSRDTADAISVLEKSIASLEAKGAQREVEKKTQETEKSKAEKEITDASLELARLIPQIEQDTQEKDAKLRLIEKLKGEILQLRRQQNSLRGTGDALQKGVASMSGSQRTLVTAQQVEDLSHAVVDSTKTPTPENPVVAQQQADNTQQQAGVDAKMRRIQEQKKRVMDGGYQNVPPITPTALRSPGTIGYNTPQKTQTAPVASPPLSSPEIQKADTPKDTAPVVVAPDVSGDISGASSDRSIPPPASMDEPVTPAESGNTEKIAVSLVQNPTEAPLVLSPAVGPRSSSEEQKTNTPLTPQEAQEKAKRAQQEYQQNTQAQRGVQATEAKKTQEVASISEDIMGIAGSIPEQNIEKLSSMIGLRDPIDVSTQGISDMSIDQIRQGKEIAIQNIQEMESARSRLAEGIFSDIQAGLDDDKKNRLKEIYARYQGQPTSIEGQSSDIASPPTDITSVLQDYNFQEYLLKNQADFQSLLPEKGTYIDLIGRERVWEFYSKFSAYSQVSYERYNAMIQNFGYEENKRVAKMDEYDAQLAQLQMEKDKLKTEAAQINQTLQGAQGEIQYSGALNSPQDYAEYLRSGKTIERSIVGTNGEPIPAIYSYREGKYYLEVYGQSFVLENKGSRTDIRSYSSMIEHMLQTPIFSHIIRGGQFALEEFEGIFRARYPNEPIGVNMQHVQMVIFEHLYENTGIDNFSVKTDEDRLHLMRKLENPQESQKIISQMIQLGAIDTTTGTITRSSLFRAREKSSIARMNGDLDRVI